MADQLTARETVLVNAITSGLKSLWPEPQDKTMDGNGVQYRALQTEMESNRAEFHDFRNDVNLRFSEFSTALKGIDRTLTGLVSGGAAGTSSEAKGLGGMGTILGVAALCLSIAGAFGTVIKMNIDTNVADAQDRTVTAERHLTEDLASLAGTVRIIQETTIPRPELDSRLGFIREVQQTKADKAVTDQIVARIDGQVSYLRSDIERMKGDIVTRRENESHWNDVQNRLNLLSDRVNDLAKSTNGASLSDQLKSLQEQVTSLVQKFIVVQH